MVAYFIYCDQTYPEGFLPMNSWGYNPIYPTPLGQKWMVIKKQGTSNLNITIMNRVTIEK